jgi:PelA/Pel-15E family pectate lyase
VNGPLPRRTSGLAAACGMAMGLVAVVSPLAGAAAEPSGAAITEARIERLAEPERAAWRDSLVRSRSLADADAAALAAEVAAAGLTAALRAPEGPDFRVSEKPGAAWFASAEAGRLADVLISFQAPCGGWSKHVASDAARRPGMQWTSQSAPGTPARYLATIDNGATTGQIRFLAEVWRSNGRDDCRDAARRGVDYLLAAQFPNGGWPQVHPLAGGYHDAITFNDDAVVHVLEILLAIGRGDAAFACVDLPRRERAKAALARGVACILATQMVRDGQRTVWCAQHDALSLEPVAARAMEPAAASGVESASILRLLMRLPDPSPEVVAAIGAARAWLDAARIRGLAKTRRDGRTAYVPDPAAPDLWARFYDLQTGRPIFPGRDGVVYDSFEALAARNELGYDYYSTRPGGIVDKEWRRWRESR